MVKFYATVSYTAVIEADNISQVYDAFPENIYMDSGLGVLDYDSADVYGADGGVR